MFRARVLVLGQELAAMPVLRGALDEPRARATIVESPDEARAILLAAVDSDDAFDVVLVDEALAAEDVLLRLSSSARDSHFVVVCRSIESASRYKFGVDVLVAPISRGELDVRIERAARWRHGYGDGGRRPRKSDVLVGAGNWLKRLYDQVSMAAPTSVSVLINGESGTGKELVARTIHSLSDRFTKPFIVVNCAAIPDGLIEDELFGHVRGAYTDANQDRPGLVAMANGGTLFLDEIGEIPLAVQAKLLRVLQSGEVRPIGANQTTTMDVRFIAATNRNLESDVEAGLFREDLFYRINVFPVVLPPLRERREDIPMLADYFVRQHRQVIGRLDVRGFSPEALEALARASFPGNVRELENVIQRGLVMCRGPWITPEDLSLGPEETTLVGEIDVDRPYRELKREALSEFERTYVDKLLTKHGGNLAAAARAAAMDRKNLWSLVKKAGLDPDSYRGKE